MGGGQDRHVIQMIANASLDVIEDVVKRNTAMSVFLFAAFLPIGMMHCAPVELGLR